MCQTHTQNRTMNKLWHTFTELHNGSYLARDIFEELCFEILDKHYPGRKIIVNSEIDKASKRSLNVVFLSKYITDELTNSRKGQIRNAFNSFVDYVKKNKIKIYEWILCIPYTLNDEETKWWGSWQTKNYQKYNINIKLFDGDYIIDLTKKYGLFDKYFKVEGKKQDDEKQDDIEKKIEKEQAFEIIDDNFEQELKDKKKEILSKQEKNEVLNEENQDKHLQDDNGQEKNNKIDEKQLENQEKGKSKNKKVVVEELNPKEDNSENKEFTFVEKIKYKDLEKEYKRIIAIAKELSEEDQKILKEINSTENCFKLFEKPDIENLNVIKLFYKAKSAEVHKDYPLATYLYEEILRNKDVNTLLRFKKDEIPKMLRACKIKTQAILYELEADVHFLRESDDKALSFYEKAYKTDKDNKHIAKKYYKLLGEKQLENDLPAEAHTNFEKALGIEKDNKELADQERHALWLSYADNVRNIPVVNIIPLWVAFSIIPDKKTKKKLKEATKKTYIALSMLAILVIIAMVFVSVKYPKSNKQVLVAKDTLGYLQPLSVEDIAILRGDKIMANISYNKIHLVDSAIADYERALKYNSKSQTAYAHLINAENYKKNYINLAQTNILTNKDAYFISMRRASEGLQLFKYIFDPANPKEGKYGYVDTLMNIVIPPVYDFDYNTMYKGTENFTNGKALVLLKLSNGKKQFMEINKQNKIVKVY